MKIGAAPEGSDQRRAAIYLAACAGLAAFCAVFLWAGFGLPFRVVFYEPVQRAFFYADRSPTNVSMDFYFRVVFALAVGVVCASIVGAIAARRRVPEALVRAAGVWAVALLLIGLSWYGWTLSHRVVMPPSDAQGQSD